MYPATRRLVFLVSLMIVVVMIAAGCGGPPTAEEAVETAVVATVEQTTANVDAVFARSIDAINAAVEKVNALPSQEAKAELMVADLEEINSRLDAAIAQAGDDRIQAFQDVSTNINAVIAGVNEAADQATGEQQVALQELATHLETTQATIQETIVNVLGGTPMPVVLKAEAEEAAEAVETPEAEEEAVETPEAEEEAVETPEAEEEAVETPEAEEEAEPVHWSYEGEGGPENWGSLEPDYAACGEGMEQSPVDIPADAPVNADDVGYAYTESAVNIVNNGHAIQVNYDEGSTVEIDGVTYPLKQFHFHSLSEHTVAGVNMDMEMHLVHAYVDGNNSEYDAVISVLLVEGAENPAFAPVWDNMPAEEGDPVTIDGAFVNVGDLLPEDRSYYHYMGSLTTPPCTEGVNWHVLVQPVELSADQLAAFRAIHDGTNRPVQPMNDRQFE